MCDPPISSYLPAGGGEPPSAAGAVGAGPADSGPGGRPQPLPAGETTPRPGERCPHPRYGGPLGAVTRSTAV